MDKINDETTQLLSIPAKRRAWVIYQLLLEGRSLADVARGAGVKRQTLYHAFTRPYPRMEFIIASALGMTPQQLFAERYGSDGLPLRRSVREAHHGLHGGQDSELNGSLNTIRKASSLMPLTGADTELPTSRGDDGAALSDPAVSG